MPPTEAMQIAGVSATLEAHLKESEGIKSFIFRTLDDLKRADISHHDFKNEMKNDIKWVKKIGIVLIMLSFPQMIEFFKIFSK